MKRTPTEKPGSVILSWITTVAVLGILCLAVILVVVPKVMGGTSLTVLTGSMKPGIMPGDVVVTKAVNPEVIAALKVGDIIVFLPYADDSMVVTHRIIGVSSGSDGRSFITQGDNNNAPDEWNPVRADQIRGQMMYVVPKIGFFKQWFGSHTNWILYGVAALVLVYAVVSFTGSLRKSKTSPSHKDDVPVGASVGDDTPRRALVD
ncbi:MAG: signal peptidase I [Propionibacteriaceae bacterium]|nr:signal peptidase I [Propionibacteriaceae bacterium]